MTMSVGFPFSFSPPHSPIFSCAALISGMFGPKNPRNKICKRSEMEQKQLHSTDTHTEMPAAPKQQAYCQSIPRSFVLRMGCLVARVHWQCKILIPRAVYNVSLSLGYRVLYWKHYDLEHFGYIFFACVRACARVCVLFVCSSLLLT